MNAQREAVHQLAISESRESWGDLLGDLMAQSSDLVKGEVALVRAELLEKIRLYSSALLVIAGGAVCGLMATMALLAVGIIALSTYTGLARAGLIFAVALGISAALFMTVGLRNLKRYSS